MMGRKRKHRHDLPQRMYFNHGAYYYVTKKGEWIYLAKKHSAALARYGEIMESPGGKGVLSDIINRYLREVASKKAPRTYKGYLQGSKKLLAVFGQMSPDEVTPQDIYAFIDQRGAPIAANREVSLLSIAYKYAIRWGLASDNPCRLVSKNPEKPRDREVTDDEFSDVHSIASASIQCAMDFADMCGLRLGDVLSLNERDNVTEEGIHVITGKTKKKMLFVWTDELSDLYARCKKLRPEGTVVNFNYHLVCTRSGQRFTLDGFETVWKRTMDKAIEKELITARFTFHDLRARAAGRSSNATELLGHDDPKTTNRIYKRITRKVTPNKPNILGKE